MLQSHVATIPKLLMEKKYEPMSIYNKRKKKGASPNNIYYNMYVALPSQLKKFTCSLAFHDYLWARTSLSLLGEQDLVF